MGEQKKGWIYTTGSHLSVGSGVSLVISWISLYMDTIMQWIVSNYSGPSLSGHS